MQASYRQPDAVPSRAALRVRPLLLALVGLCLAGAAWLFDWAARAQAPDFDRPLPTKDRTFRIPFQTQPGDRRLREVQLLYSTDQGRTWRQYATATPEQGQFQPFTAQSDGLYWFAVRTIDTMGRAYPLTDADLRPGLKVLVDSQPPRILLRPIAAQGNNVGVEWDVREENLDLAGFRLEYLAAGAAQYAPLQVTASAVGQHIWTPVTNGPMEVRLTVNDAAGNQALEKVIVTPGGGAAPYPGTGGTPPVNLGVRLVNSKRISLNYRLDDVGPSGVALIELWYTQDGRNWQKFSEDTNCKPPLVFDVPEEALYGFSLVPKSGVGVGPRPPQLGDIPQVWVEVDLTRPVVRLTNVDVGRGTETGTLTITWSAADKNLAKQPITLSYSEKAEGPWTPIAGNLENLGRHGWRMPPGIVPYRFLVRVEAADRAGNVGSDQTAAPVIVDLSQPRATIGDVGPGAPK